MLYRGAKILILDEPTAVLTPQETHRLFDVLRNMRADGNAIVIITHKLNEVLELSDRVAVLRKGRYIGSVDTASASIASLTEMMVGKRVELNIVRSEPKQLKRRLAVKDVSCVNPEGVITLNHVSFTLDGGEILGIAGVAGSGQRELLETIGGVGRNRLLPAEPRAAGADEAQRRRDQPAGRPAVVRAGGPAGHGPGRPDGHG